MISIFHLSDLHFGRKFDPRLSELVLQEIVAARPDLTIISGDFTLRGRVSEYEQAHAYLEKIPPPVVTIPGNHDQPLHWGGLVERLTDPWARYRRYIHPTVDVAYRTPALCVIGINDNHPLIPGGLWSSAQREWMAQQLQHAPRGACKIVVTHHQLLWNTSVRPLGKWFPTRHLNWLAQLGVELVLNGHTHIPLAQRTPQGLIVSQAGTATSTRVRRGQGNTYNRIVISPESIRVQIVGYDGAAGCFRVRAESTFPRKLKVGEGSSIRYAPASQLHEPLP